uniref:Uncharacterized protein n=1 Tax=Bactrocera dorsalis TaxID=27457 RepID=A0A034WG73_BACDO
MKETTKKVKVDDKINIERNIIIKPLSITNTPNPYNLEKLTYDEDHQGPFVVYIDTKYKGNERSPINAGAITGLMKKLNYGHDDIKEINKVGYGRIKVICKTARIANEVCNSQHLKDKGYEPKILQHCIAKVGIIFDIPTEITMEELMKDIPLVCQY